VIATTAASELGELRAPTQPPRTIGRQPSGYNEVA